YTRKPTKAVFDTKAFDYEKVDFVRSAELVLDSASATERKIYAQVDFVERLYIHATNAKIDFGVRPAFLTIHNQGAGNLLRRLDFNNEHSRARYITLHAHSDAI